MLSGDSTGAPHIDHRFNIPSYEQYLADLETKKFNKMCMTDIINADMMIATFGEEAYYKSSSEILAMGNAGYKQLGIDHLIHVYAQSYRNFMAVANDDISDDDFFNLMKGFHEQYELATAQQTGLGGISRFCLAFGDDLVNRVKSAYYMNRDLQNNFIVATDEKERLAVETEKELQIFELLKYALENSTAVPFYQGIYNNKANKITKYEALMRVFDKDGNIYPPGMLLDVAKKLKLYLPLSKMVLDKALSQFENKQSELNVNVSLYDIQSEEFTEWFLNRVKRQPDPSKIVVEFVETENYNNNDQMIDFLNKVRDIGCKIAVDDFGVGFATYTSIVSLKPDIIKIDGDIIKNLTKTEESRLILDSICYMAKLLGAETTAEFVENAAIQQVILEHDIMYSQGYYYAKPESIDSLSIE